ncbi:MAG: hypothetical protein AAGJ87_01785 [Pseudomonadota bacterium]
MTEKLTGYFGLSLYYSLFPPIFRDGRRTHRRARIFAFAATDRINAQETEYGMTPIIHQLIGSVCILVGLVLLPLPIPFGLILLTIGFAMIAPYVPAVQRLITRMRRKWPNLDRSLLRHRHRFPPVIRKTIDKTHPHAPAE